MADARTKETPRYTVFVYGSLLSGFGNHVLLDNTTYLGPQEMTYPGPMITMGGFPALIKTNDRLSVITGEVYSVNNQQFARLDRLEGYPDFYNREIRRLRNNQEAWVYFLPPRSVDHLTVVESGNWRLFRRGEYAPNEV